MEVLLSTLSLELPQGATLRLDAARGVTVRVRHGRLWLTEQGLLQEMKAGRENLYINPALLALLGDRPLARPDR